MIANTQMFVDPVDRDPPYTNPEPAELAQAMNICVMSTKTLYDAICRHQQGALDVPGFWAKVVSTDGILEWP